MQLFRHSKKLRFDMFDPSQTLDHPEIVGIVSSAQEHDLGLPNLERNENVTLFGSNCSTKETLVAKFKWRPCNSDADGESGPKLVTLVSRLYFSTPDGQCYHSQQVETYEPQQVLVHSLESSGKKRIKQFGSRASQLKLYVASPYRRIRLVFVGQVRRVSDGASAFLRLSCVLNPTARIFDFLEQYNEQYVQQVCPKGQSAKKLAQRLLLHDRHEQKCRLMGEYSLIEAGERTRRDIALWGYHSRHLIESCKESAPLITKRIYGYMQNGQGFSLGNNQLGDEQITYGHITFSTHPMHEALSKPISGIDWRTQIDAGLQEFELQVEGMQQKFTVKTLARRAAQFEPSESNFLWFEVEMNETAGHSFVSLDDELVDNEVDRELISVSREQRRAAMSVGSIAALPSPSLSSEALILSLDDGECSCSHLVGAKAASLAELIKLEQKSRQDTDSAFKVTRGFATTKRAHDELMDKNASIKEGISKLQRVLMSSDAGHSLADACTELVEHVSSLELPASISEQLELKLAKDYADKPELKFAVRSSSWGEDEQDMSAAGQLTTLLNVPNELGQLKRAIMACFASKFSPENVEYKRQHGLPLDLPMGVVVQQMVSCEKAGVMFTCDPTTGDPSLVTITANYGLGESVVSAQAEPDSIQVRAALDGGDELLRIESIQVGSKQVVVSESTSAQQADKSKCCLSDDEALSLARCALQVRAYFWNEQRDIEWGLFEGQLYLFQSRPVTGLEPMTNREFLEEASKPSQAELGFYSRANIGEVMPYASTPFTLTASIFSWTVMSARSWAPLFGQLFSYIPQCTSDIYYEQYHSYFNLRCSVILALNDKTSTTKSMEIGMFGREMGPQPEIARASRGFPQAPDIFKGYKFNWHFRSIVYTPMRAVTKQRSIMQKLRQQVRSNHFVPSKPGEPSRLIELFKLIGKVEECHTPAWVNHIVNIMTGTRQNVILTYFLSKYIQDPMQLTAASNMFLGITANVISAEIPERVDAMAREIELKGRGELERFVSMDDAEALNYLQDKANVNLNRKLDEFMKLFGHRCYNEFELREKSWREQPEKVVEMVKINCRAKLASAEIGEGASEKKTEARPKTIDEVFDSLPALKDAKLMKRLIIKYSLVPKSQLLLAVREQTKDIIVMNTDILREVTRMLGEELQRQSRLPDADLIYFLLYDELLQLVFDHQPGLVMNALRRRQLYKQNFGQQIWKYDEIFSDLTPIHLKREARAKIEARLAEAPKLSGTPASSGRVQGQVCLVNGYEELHKVRPGCILLTHSTDIAFSPIFPLISGIITEVGGLISHGAVVAREYGLPSVIGIPQVTQILEDGEEIVLDADSGTIVRLGKQQQQQQSDGQKLANGGT